MSSPAFSRFVSNFWLPLLIAAACTSRAARTGAAGVSGYSGTKNSIGSIAIVQNHWIARLAWLRRPALSWVHANVLETLAR